MISASLESGNSYMIFAYLELSISGSSTSYNMSLNAPSEYDGIFYAAGTVRTTTASGGGAVTWAYARPDENFNISLVGRTSESQGNFRGRMLILKF